MWSRSGMAMWSRSGIPPAAPEADAWPSPGLLVHSPSMPRPVTTAPQQAVTTAPRQAAQGMRVAARPRKAWSGVPTAT